MDTLIGRRKRLLLLIILLVLFLACTVFIVYFFFIKDNSKPAEDNQQAGGNLIISDFELMSTEEILKQYSADPDTAYVLLMSNASKKIYVEKYSEAIDFYKAAAAVEGINQENKDEANLSVYYTAKKVGNKSLQDEYALLLGDKLTSDANTPKSTSQEAP